MPSAGSLTSSSRASCDSKSSSFTAGPVQPAGVIGVPAASVRASTPSTDWPLYRASTLDSSETVYTCPAVPAKLYQSAPPASREPVTATAPTTSVRP